MAFQRVSKETTNAVEILKGDIRNIDLPVDHIEIILAGAVLHHLREDED